MAKLISGREITYTCIPIDKEVYDTQKEDLHNSVHGFVVKGVFYPAEDVTQACKMDWCLPIVESYTRSYWVILNKHPGDVYYPMSDMTSQDIYRVIDYDIWQSEKGLVAVVTDVDQD